MKFIYIYNIKQAEFFLKSGLDLDSIGVNNRTDKVYFKFCRNEELERVFKEWNNRQNLKK